MPKVYTDMQAAVESNLKFRTTEAAISTDDIHLAIGAAVPRYSLDRPYEQVFVITGDGTNNYTLPENWDPNFSQILGVEYRDRNIETSDSEDAAPEPINFLKASEVQIYNPGGGDRLYFRNIKLKAATETSIADKAVIRYSGSHVLTQSELDMPEGRNTIPDSDFIAVGYLATALAAWKAAGESISNASRQRGGAGEGVLGTFRTKSDLYAAYAKDMMKLYYQYLRIDPKKSMVPPFVAIGNVDLELDLFNHPRI